MGAAILLPIVAYQRLMSQRAGDRLDRRQEGLFILVTLRPVGVLCMLGLVAYTIDPTWMAWSKVALPRWLRRTGVGLGILAGFLLIWTLRSLGRNLTDTVVTRREHTLVTHGPYRLVRYPFYVSTALAIAANALAAANGFVLGTGAAALVLIAIRFAHERKRSCCSRGLVRPIGATGSAPGASCQWPSRGDQRQGGRHDVANWKQGPGFLGGNDGGKSPPPRMMGDGWCALFSHPKDFTPVCTTELGYMAKLLPEFSRRNCKIIGLSVDPVEDHRRWSVDIKEATGHEPAYPMIGDSDLAVAKLYGMLPEDAGSTAKGRSAADNQTVRTVYVIGPDKLIHLLPDEHRPQLRRGAAARRFRAADGEAQGGDAGELEQGEDVIIVPAVSDEDARKKFPAGWRAPKPYLRIVPQPQD